MTHGCAHSRLTLLLSLFVTAQALALPVSAQYTPVLASEINPTGQLGIGSHNIPLATDGLPSGAYIVRAQSGGEAVTSRLVVIR